jgi:hypothetical protein
MIHQASAFTKAIRKSQISSGPITAGMAISATNPVASRSNQGQRRHGTCFFSPGEVSGGAMRFHIEG